MQFNTFITSRQELEQAAQIPTLSEVLLEPILLARQGTLTQPQLFDLAQAAVEVGLKPVLVWDILMTESALATIGDRILSWDLHHFAAIRVVDVGVAQWLLEQLPHMPLQLSVESGNHNLQGLLGWCDLFQATLERLVLSIELPEEKLAHYCKVLPVPCELLGVGRILLFYSPRKLLSPELQEVQAELIEATIQTDEYGDRFFPTQESIHGTMMYLDKDQFLLDQLTTLAACGFHTIRIDLRHLKGLDDPPNLTVHHVCEQAYRDPSLLKTQWPVPVRAPFFKANRTTAVFSRLKSQLAPLKNETCVAECIGSKNGEYGIFRTLRPFHREQIAQMILPNRVAVPISDQVVFHRLSGEVLGSCGAHQTIIMSWIKRTASGAILVRHEGS